MGSRTIKGRPAASPEEKENRLIALAYDLAEQRLIEGTATSQEVCHFLKQGTEKVRLENEKLKEENRLLRARTTSLQNAAELSEVYEKAINAMRVYSGHAEEEEMEDEEFA